MSRLGELMARDVVTVAPEDTVGEAAQRMSEQNIGSADVLEHGRLIGIFTERDVLNAVGGRAHPSEARVRESAGEAARVMLEHGFRHLPVVEGERTVGIVSLRDVMRWSMLVAPGAEQVGSDFP
ncbi:MAG: CBS domain-containing protein [Actinobacteria bacterium]|nr:MAG: CBS domain-containing protein [Actinomycetota bacterium]